MLLNQVSLCAKVKDLIKFNWNLMKQEFFLQN